MSSHSVHIIAKLNGALVYVEDKIRGEEWLSIKIENPENYFSNNVEKACTAKHFLSKFQLRHISYSFKTIQNIYP